MISVNQLSIYGALADLRKELDKKSSEDSAEDSSEDSESFIFNFAVANFAMANELELMAAYII